MLCNLNQNKSERYIRSTSTRKYYSTKVFYGPVELLSKILTRIGYYPGPTELTFAKSKCLWGPLQEEAFNKAKNL